MESKCIVCGVTASKRSQHAVLDAAKTARKTGAKLVCVHVVDMSFFKDRLTDPLSRAFIENSLIHLGMQMVDHAAQIAKTEGVTVEKHLVKGSVRKCLHRLARDLGADLLVLGGAEGKTIFRDVLKPANGDESGDDSEGGKAPAPFPQGVVNG